MNKMYAISRFYDNGEPWEDHYTGQMPVMVFDSLSSAEDYCRARGVKVEDSYLSDKEIVRYAIHKEKEYVKCPAGKDWQECDEDFDEDYCCDCQNDNRDMFYDFSFEQLKIYEVEKGFEMIKEFDSLDDALKKLGKSDSSVEYAEHIRSEFSRVLTEVNVLKHNLGNHDLVKSHEWYFGWED